MLLFLFLNQPIRKMGEKEKELDKGMKKADRKAASINFHEAVWSAHFKILKLDHCQFVGMYKSKMASVQHWNK